MLLEIGHRSYSRGGRQTSGLRLGFILTRFSATRDVAISRRARVLAPAAWAAGNGKDLAGVPPECQGGWRINGAPTPLAESRPFLKPIARGLSAGSPPTKLGAAQAQDVASAASGTRAWIQGQQAALPCMERHEGAAGSRPNGRGMFEPNSQRPVTPPSRSRPSAASVVAFGGREKRFGGSTWSGRTRMPANSCAPTRTNATDAHPQSVRKPARSRAARGGFR